MRHHINTWAQWPGAGIHAGQCADCGASAAFDTWDELNTWITEHEENNSCPGSANDTTKL